MKTLLDVPAGNALIGSGIALGADPVAAALWSEGENVVFRDGKVQKAAGWEHQATLDEDIYEVAQANVAGEKRAYIGTPSKLYKWADGWGLTELGSGFVSGDWSLAIWGTWLLATNGVDVPKVWKNTSTVEDLAGVTFTTAKIFIRKTPYVFALNTSNGDNFAEWCSDDNVELWTPAAGNTAGQLVLRDLDSEIVAGAPLGVNIGVYSKQSMGLLEYTANNFVFGFYPQLKGIGALSKRSVIPVSKVNYGLSLTGFWRTDGASSEFIDGADLRKWYEKNMNFDAASTVKGYHNIKQNEVTWWLPIGSSAVPNCGVGINYVNGAVSYYDFAPSACAPDEVFPNPLLAFGTTLNFGERGYNAASLPLSAYVQTKPLDCTNQEIYKRIQAIRLGIATLGTVQLLVGLQNSLDDAITWLPAQDAERIVNILDRETVFVTLKVLASGIDSDFRLDSFKILGQPGGAVI